VSDYRKKLIEVALPLDAINAESAREKSIRHGHPSTLHLWWARRPLAACRAVLFAQLVDDPSAHPDRFPDEAAQDAERQRLFGILERLVKWENSTNEAVLAEARAEIVKSCNSDPPPILDPFAGGGSIPLEAQRLGLEAHASDLNPVAVLINKALIEIPPRFAGQPPVHPKADNRASWQGAEGLAEDVRRYGQWMRDEAETRIGHLYPKATLPNGNQTTVIAWIWARTVTCPNPACVATMPLVRSFWLGKKKGKEAWIKPVVEGKQVRFEIAHDRHGPDSDGTVDRSGATCLVCQQPVKFDHIRAEGRAGRMGATLMAIAAEGDRRREYLPPTSEHTAASKVDRPDGTPDGELFDWPGRINVVRYGLTEFRDLFTNRQLTALMTFTDLVAEARAITNADALAAGRPEADATSYADGIVTYLAFAVSRTTNRLSSVCGWDSSPKMEGIRSVFARQAIPMVWDYAESNPFSESSGNFEDNLATCASTLDFLVPSVTGRTIQADARDVEVNAVVATDPPYYDNIGYADLSDFFYVWLRQSLKSIHPDLFGTMVTPKAAELIATPYRHDGSKGKAERYFEDGFVDVFTNACRVQDPRFPLTLFYAFKQAETTSEGGVASTGWSTMLEGLQAAGWMVTATWPMRTELANKIGMNANMLASSVVLSCRPRPATAGITDRQGLVRALHAELPAALRELEKASIAPVDLRQAAIGPGMAVFSRFARVVEPDGSTMRVRTALGLINQVLDAVLSEQEAEFDAETRWAIAWFSQYFFDTGPYGVAETLSVAMAVSVAGMQQSGILRSGGGKVRLLAPDELDERWDPTTDMRRPIWEATHHLVRRLDVGGEAAAAALLAQVGGVADSCRALAYRLYTICETPRPALAGPYNALAASWTEIQRLGQAGPVTPVATAEQQSFDVGQS
jgi:putative DNA methylase